MPTLASLALATFFLLVPLTPSVASVLQVCVGPAGALLAVAPSAQCPRNHGKVSLPVGASPTVNYYTVQRPTELVGPGTITAVTVSCEDGDRVVSGGYVHTKDQPNLQVSGSAPTGERGWLVQVQNFSETLSYELVLYARCERLTP
jgi:hypothetical protein